MHVLSAVTGNSFDASSLLKFSLHKRFLGEYNPVTNDLCLIAPSKLNAFPIRAGPICNQWREKMFAAVPCMVHH